MRIALIGSRDLERKTEFNKDIDLCYRVCRRLAILGHTFTSGLCADGMDGIAQKAYSQALSDNLTTTDKFEVYIGSEVDRSRSRLPNKHLAKVMNNSLLLEIEEIASKVHPAWNRCNDWAKRMHMRNVHQILGYDLKSPVDCVICWTPNGLKKGGTKTAIEIALLNNIPVFNLGIEDKDLVIKEIKEFLDKGV